MRLTDDELMVLERRDVQRKIGQFLNLPLRPGLVTKIDANTNLEELRDANVTVGDRIVLSNMVKAMNGDVKSAEFLFKFGGYAPVVEAQVEVTLPTIIDDMTLDYVESEVIERSDKQLLESPEQKKPNEVLEQELHDD